MIRRPASVGGMVVALVALMGCAQGDPAPAPSNTAAPAEGAQPSQTAAAAPALVAEYEAPVDADVEMKAPEGWTKSTRSGWAVWTSPDKRVQIAVAPVEETRSAEPKVAELEKVFGVTEVRLNKLQPLTIGVDQMAAQATDGAARFASGDGGIAYAALDTRGPKRAAVAYAFEKGATDEARQQMMAAVGSLRNKR